MNKLISFILISVLILIPSLVLCTPPHSNSLRVATFDLYPSVFMEDSQPKGLCVDLLRAMAEKEDWTLTFVHGTWEEGLKRIKRHEVDIITSAIYTEERDTYMDYSTEPIMTVWVEVFAARNIIVKDVFSLKDKTIAVMPGDQNGYVFMDHADALELNCIYKYYKSHEEILAAIEQGRVDAGVVNNITGASRGHAYNIVKTNIILSPYPMYFAVAEGAHPEILEAIDDHLYSWKNNQYSIYHEKLNEWFRKKLDVQKEIPNYISLIILILSLLAFGAIIVSIFLNKIVDIKTREIRETKNKFKSLFDHAPLSYQSLNSLGDIIEVNKTWLETMGYNKLEVIGKNFSHFLNPEYQKHFLTNFPKFKAVGEILGVEFEMRRKDGSFIIVAFHGKVALNSKKEFKQTHCVFRDVTELKAIEHKLLHSQKMESVGTLAAGISHDFNNILFIMMSTAQLVMMDMEKGSRNYNLLDNINKAGDRGTNLIRQILSFSRQGVQELTNIDIKPIVKEVLKLSKTTIPKNVNITNNIDETQSYVILADPTQVHQVVLNLITNAYHAVEDIDGEVSVELKKVHLFNGALLGKDLKPGYYAQLTIADKGYGMSPEVMDKIFDPYFTTKGNGKGTGLGLSVVYGIVKEYGGDIKVYSEPEKGTVFNVYLPVVDKQVAAKEDTTTCEESLQGTGTVMIVDDETQIVLVEQLYFTRHGYTTETFTCSTKALQAFQEDPYKYDILITDMAMPELPGDKLSKKILEIRPEIPIIMCSGFSERMNESTAKEIGIKRYLMKPVDVNNLVGLSRKLIERSKEENTC